MDSIIFDLDGTLWDSRSVVADVWNNVLEENGYKGDITEGDLKRIMGLQHKEIGEKLFPDILEEQREDLFKQFGEGERKRLSQEGGQLFRGVENVLTELAKTYEMYIVSNCPDGYIESFYAYHQLDEYFFDFEHPGRTGLSKGENIRLIMERNHLQDPVYVGDTEGDQKASAEAGVPFIYATYGFGDVKDPDHTIEAFSDLLELLLPKQAIER